jgi:hypothetical protein
MAEVSDFDIATGSQFLSGSRNLNANFYSGGRNTNKRIFMQISGLGGYSAGRNGLTFRANINGTRIGTFTFRRWTDHTMINFDHIFLDFNSNVLNGSGSNTIAIEPLYSGSSDYCWIGPIIVHFRQNA